jgi:phage FluMu gp28-like protein
MENIDKHIQRDEDLLGDPILDEFAFVPNHIADSFFASVYPTITSGKNTKVIIVSTPHGMNHFYRMWHDAEKGKNEYIFTDVHWSEVPDTIDFSSSKKTR